ncbi:Protein PLANT CADMIUM RESISTANCE like [Quillaja saponaria]|uniref:Protein PLANT CADMIUM RESISTANCE like n=1 Tax=Quillaja saponaria TaxID=32244 RepID=A0AAD7L1D9_QUISA|nr:Protein PLANT CADMIUM RESISTANCE like [Quillaja saponaria]
MNSQSGYVPPSYIPLGQSDSEAGISPQQRNEGPPAHRNNANGSTQMKMQWSSGVCACCDDMQSCFIGLFCPCFLFAKNAEFLGSGTFIGSCMTHFILWALANTVCCLLTEGIWLVGLPGYCVACYACGYRRELRSKFNLQEEPCGDFATHFFCHLCAICQEYREIRERAGDSESVDMNLAVVTAPPVQTMESDPKD